MRKSGARGLRAILETIMLELMYEIPSRDDVEEVIVSEEVVDQGGAEPCWFSSTKRNPRSPMGIFRNEDGDSDRGAGARRVMPLLPLRDIVVYPHMVVPLYVGRPKSIRRSRRRAAATAGCCWPRSARRPRKSPPTGTSTRSARSAPSSSTSRCPTAPSR